MSQAPVLTILGLAAALSSPACNRPQQAEERPAAANADDITVRERSNDTAELETRVAELERKWTEMQTKVKEESRTPTPALRDEVREDVTNLKDAVAGLKTTTAENWWERHERATERTLDDVEADVQRFAKRNVATEPAAKPEPVGTTAGFEERRNAWIASARARVDGMEDRLEDVKADGARDTELQDTRARIDKLQDDLDRLRSVSADEWWDVSAARVREYIDRVERSIGRLDNDKS